MILEKVISGGQSGADQAGLRAARAAGISTGGWAPKGWLTEDGPAPWLADYGLVEHPSPAYPPRTRVNVRNSAATLIFAAGSSPGTDLTIRECERLDRPYRIVIPRRDSDGRLVLHPVGITEGQIAEWIEAGEFRVLNVAGNRESKNRGIGKWVERYLVEVFAILKGERGRP